jgi:hypothetical protein
MFDIGRLAAQYPRLMLLAEVVFASRLLGLVAGEQSIDLQADATVRKIELQRDGQTLATLTRPPWKTTVDFGPELRPQQFTAVAYDKDGYELGRDVQAVNVDRPMAEVGIVVDRDDATGQMSAKLAYTHRYRRKPLSIKAWVDGKRVSDGLETRIPLGVIDPQSVHVLRAELEFPNGVTAKKEVVFGGIYSEYMPAELTPVAVRQKHGDAKLTEPCFHVDGRPLQTHAIERGEGVVYFIRNGGRGFNGAMPTSKAKGDALFVISGADLRLVHPISRGVGGDPSDPAAFFFGGKFGGEGTRQLLQMTGTPNRPVRLADAIGATGLRAVRGEQRRVIVVILGDSPARDESAHSVATVRRYLERIGVPLHVWSLVGKRPELEAVWGEVKDVSKTSVLARATEELRRELESQRIAWLPVAPLDAFRATADERCAFTPLAHAD